MTDIATLVPALRRELAIPGTFDTVFPDTTEDDLIGSLADGFSEAQLYGFFPTIDLQETSGVWATDPDLSAAGGALVVIFTSMRFIRAQIRALNTQERYKAGPVEMETQKAASVLKEELVFLQKRLQDIIDESRRATRAMSVHVIDNYLARGGGITSGLYPYEYRG